MNYQDLIFTLPGIAVGWYARKYWGRWMSLYYSARRVVR